MAHSFRKTKRQRFMYAVKKLPGLVAYYPLSETAGTLSLNYAPANLGQFQGSYVNGTISVPGEVGRGYAGDFSSSQINYGTYNPSTGDLSSLYFFNWSGGTAHPNNLVSKRDGFGTATDMWQTYIETNGELKILMGVTVNSFNPAYHPGSLNWHNIMWVHDSASNAERLYDLGVQQGTHTLMTYGSLPSAHLQVGANQTTAQDFFGGTIQHMALVNQVVTAGQYRKLSHLAGFI